MQALTISPTPRSLAFACHASRRRQSSIAGPASFLAAITLLLALLPGLAGGASTSAPIPAPLPAPSPVIDIGD